MYLLTCLFILFVYCDDTDIEKKPLLVDIDKWVNTIVTQTTITWAQDDPCNVSITHYASLNYTQLNYSEKSELLFCLMKQIWYIKDNEHIKLPKCACDDLFDKVTDFKLLEGAEKSELMTCMLQRVYIDSLRLEFQMPWLPSDLLTNPLRKYMWIHEMTKGFTIYWQYFSDQENRQSLIHTKQYQKKWVSLGLNISHYSDYHSNYKLRDYFEWNNATQYDAVKTITIRFWNIVSSMITLFDNLKISTILENGSHKDMDSFKAIINSVKFFISDWIDEKHLSLLYN
jgi:hypothetical protein